jgi:hyperosmotically inducible periplasmic protein
VNQFVQCNATNSNAISPHDCNHGIALLVAGEPAVRRTSPQRVISMRIKLRLCRAMLFCALIGGVTFTTAMAQEQDGQPDNSAQNKSQSQTAQNQSTDKSDRMTTANVRKAIVADKQLSSYAHNVKVITVNGTVTLKGPVRSDAEKQQITNDASQVVSQDKIVDQLTVKQ